jgi:hypothetical protein
VLRWGVLLFAMLGQIAIPRTLHRTVAAYWGRLLAVLFILIGVGGMVAKDDALKATGAKGLAVMLALGVGTLAIGAFIEKRPWLRHAITLLKILPLLALAGLAVWAIAAGAGEVARQVQLDSWITPFDELFIGIGLGLLVGAWFQDIWGDLKALFFRIRHGSGPYPRH